MQMVLECVEVNGLKFWLLCCCSKAKWSCIGDTFFLTLDLTACCDQVVSRWCGPLMLCGSLSGTASVFCVQAVAWV